MRVMDGKIGAEDVAGGVIGNPEEMRNCAPHLATGLEGKVVWNSV